MKDKKYRVGLSILAGGLSFVGAASATDIVLDGSFESATNNYVSTTPPVGQGGTPGASIDGGWTPFTTYSYVTGYTMPGPAGCGQVYLRPYNDQVNAQTVSQIDSLTRAITTNDIDTSQGHYTLSAWFSTYLAQNDYSDLTLQFLDASQSPIGSPVNLGGAAFVAALPTDNKTKLRYWGKDTRFGLVPPLARYASITTVSTALSGWPDGYVDLVSLNVVAGTVPVQLATANPLDNAIGVSPAATLGVTLEDGTAVLNTNSVLFAYDGSPVSAMIQKVGTTTTVQYDPPGLMASLSAHTYRVAFNDSGGATANTTNQFSFTVAPYVNVNLGTALNLETFDGVAEGALPAGWSVASYTDQDLPGFDLNNFHSDSFTNWAVISRSTLSNWFDQVPDGDYYRGTLNVAPNQVINNALVTNLISGNFIIAAGDRATDLKEVDYLYTGDYNLSGKGDVYLAFHDIYVQNQNQIASVEYSTNSGSTWLPALYMLDGPDILLDSVGNIDASNTFATVHSDVPNIAAGTVDNGFYGQYIGVKSNLWSTLAPFISARGNDDEVGSKRMEVIRLPYADRQHAVRFRMALAVSYGWYFGIDDFGLYSISSVSPPLLASGPTPSAQTIAFGNTASITLADPYGVGPFSFQWRQNGTNMPGRTGRNLVLPVVSSSAAGSYDVVVSNPGGSVTSPPPAAVLTVINPPVYVTGQWDFLSNNLAASYGIDMQFYDATVQADTTFGTTTSFGLANITNGADTTVMHFTPSVAAWGGYKMFHGAAPNGGGAYVNQYTLIFDIYYPTGSDSRWRSLWQTATGNGNDGDLFVGTSDGLGISSIYDGYISPDAWHRIAAAFDLSGPGEAPVLTKFVDGVKVGNQTGGLSATDGRFSLDPYALVFADNDGDVAEAYVSSIQFSNGRRPDAYLRALGGPSPLKIPGIIRADLISGQVVIHWSGGVPLQSADSVTGNWTTVPGTAGQYSYTPSPLGQQKFYRPQIP